LQSRNSQETAAQNHRLQTLKKGGRVSGHTKKKKRKRRKNLKIAPPLSRGRGFALSKILFSESRENSGGLFKQRSISWLRLVGGTKESRRKRKIKQKSLSMQERRACPEKSFDFPLHSHQKEKGEKCLRGKRGGGSTQKKPKGGGY